MIGGLGVTELVIILVIVIVIFGARRLPELGKGVGEAIKNFKKATTERDEIDVTPKEGGNKESSQDKGEKS